MNRFKFRAWDGTRMYYPGDGFTDTLVMSFNNLSGEVESAVLGKEGEQDWEVNGWYWSPYSSKERVLMQSTGLTDSNGKEIYEGDIIQVEGRTVYKVYWNQDSGCWSIVSNEGDDYGPYGGPLAVNTPYDKAKKRVVIGNIYETPKLFKKP